MIAKKNERGFICVKHPRYCNPPCPDEPLIQESSAIGDYDDAMDRPGSSFLWVGEAHHLNREEVKEMIERMQYWLDTGRLEVK